MVIITVIDSSSAVTLHLPLCCTALPFPIAVFSFLLCCTFSRLLFSFHLSSLQLTFIQYCSCSPLQFFLSLLPWSSFLHFFIGWGTNMLSYFPCTRGQRYQSWWSDSPTTCMLTPCLCEPSLPHTGVFVPQWWVWTTCLPHDWVWAVWCASQQVC